MNSNSRKARQVRLTTDNITTILRSGSYFVVWYIDRQLLGMLANGRYLSRRTNKLFKIEVILHSEWKEMVQRHLGTKVIIVDKGNSLYMIKGKNLSEKDKNYLRQIRKLLKD